jgi:hypothetical protein
MNKQERARADWGRVQRLRARYYRTVPGYLNTIDADRLERDRRIYDIGRRPVSQDEDE